MSKRRYRVEVTGSAERDFYNEVTWLIENRSKPVVKRFKIAFDRVLKRLAIEPQAWQVVEVSGRSLRRAIIEGRWIVLYKIDHAQDRVVVLGLRGAAEDWMNMPITD